MNQPGLFEAALRRVADGAPAALARALNRAALSARATLARDTARDMRLLVGDVKARMKIRQAKPNQAGTTANPEQVATVMGDAKRTPAILFGAKGPTPSRGKGRGVTARLPGRRFPQAFITEVRGRSGKTGQHVGVFVRGTDKPMTRRSRGAWGLNLPIVELKGASVWQVARKHSAAALAQGRAAFHKNTANELKRLLRGATPPATPTDE